jgi:ribosomal protein L36
MLTLSVKELQFNLYKALNGLPILVTRYGKPYFRIIDAEVRKCDGCLKMEICKDLGYEIEDSLFVKTLCKVCELTLRRNKVRIISVL